jgi:hypothetical protein
VLAVVASWSPVHAETPSVPLQLQVELSTKIVEYVQTPPISSLSLVRIGIIVKASSPESMRAGAELKAAFDRVTTLAGRAHEQSLIAWPGAGVVAEQVRRQGLTILYLTPGLDTEVAPLSSALVGLPVVTITAIDSFVASGALVGFELLSGHPKMIFNLRQARRQQVVLRAAVMKLMRIVE